MSNMQYPEPGVNSVSINYSYGNDDFVLFCVKCQGTERVSDRILSYSKVSPVAYLGFLLGPLVALFVLAITSKNHILNLPYCRKCWNRYRLTSWLSGISILIFCAALVGGVALMLSLDSGYWFWPLPIISTLLMAWLFYKKQGSMPSVKFIDSGKIVIDGGVYGDITIAYHAKLSQKA